MPWIFDKISEVLRGSKAKAMPNPNAPPTTAATDSENIPPSALLEDAMSIPSFRQVAAENEKYLKQRTKVPIDYLTNYLGDIEDDKTKRETADILLKELYGVEKFYTESQDKAVVEHIIRALQPLASDKVKKDIANENLFPIHVQKAKLLDELFENFKEAFRWNDVVVEEKTPFRSSKFKP